MDSMHAPQHRETMLPQEMVLDNPQPQRPIQLPPETMPVNVPKKKAKVPGKPRAKREKPLVCEGIPNFDFTRALRDAPLEMTIGQLMSLDKPPRAAIAKAFRSPRKAKGKAVPVHLIKDVSATALVVGAAIEGFDVPLIIDTGAPLNVISLTLLNKLGLKLT